MYARQDGGNKDIYIGAFIIYPRYTRLQHCISTIKHLLPSPDWVYKSLLTRHDIINIKYGAGSFMRSV